MFAATQSIAQLTGLIATKVQVRIIVKLLISFYLYLIRVRCINTPRAARNK